MTKLVTLKVTPKTRKAFRDVAKATGRKMFAAIETVALAAQSEALRPKSLPTGDRP